MEGLAIILDDERDNESVRLPSSLTSDKVGEKEQKENNRET